MTTLNKEENTFVLSIEEGLERSFELFGEVFPIKNHDETSCDDEDTPA